MKEPNSHTANERLQIAIEGAGLGTWDWNVATGETLYNARWAEILGYAAHEIPSAYDSWAELVHPEDYPRVVDAVHAHLGGRSAFYQAEYRLRHRNGQWIWILAHGRVYERNADGKPLRFAGIHKDITERKETAEAILLSREAYKHTVELTTQIPWSASPDGIITSCEPVWETYTGLPVAAALSNDWLDAVHPDDREPMYGRWQHSVTTGEPYRVVNRLRRRDGEFRYCESRAQPQRNAAGAIVRWYGTTEDIHERTMAERSLRESEARLILALEGARLSTWDWNIRTGEVVRDARWFSMMGFPENSTTRPAAFWIARVHPDDWSAINQKWAEHLADETKAFEAEYRILHHSGEWRWMSSHGRIVGRDDQGPTRACGTNQDITERKHSEEALANSERFSRLLLEADQDCVALLDASGTMIYLNPAGLQRLGIAQLTDRADRSWIRLWKEADRARIDQVLHSTPAEQSTSFQAYCDRAGALPGWWDVTLSRLPPGVDQGRILAVAREITHLKEQEERQRESVERERLQGILENLNEGIIIAAPDGTLLLMNGAAQRMYGADIRSRRLMRYEELFEAFEARDSKGTLLKFTDRPIARAARGEAFSGCDTFFRNRSSGREWIGSCSSTPVRSASGELLRGVLTVRDITADRKAAEEIGHANQVLHELSGQLLRLQDDERKRISRELHDGSVQVLSAALMNLTLLSELPAVITSENQRRLVTKTMDLAQQCVTELRTMSYLLHPPVFEELGLVPALRSWIDGFCERTGIPVDIVASEGIGRFAPDTETALFRITQEALANVHRHAESTTASVQLLLADEQIRLKITDDGKGFELAPSGGTLAKHKFGIGLLGMRERANQLGGSLVIESGRGGTSIRVTLPAKPVYA